MTPDPRAVREFCTFTLAAVVANATNPSQSCRSPVSVNHIHRHKNLALCRLQIFPCLGERYTQLTVQYIRNGECSTSSTNNRRAGL